MATAFAFIVKTARKREREREKKKKREEKRMCVSNFPPRPNICPSNVRDLV